MGNIDLAAVGAIIREVGQAEIMPRFRKLREGDVEMKGVNDPVTVADREAEKALGLRLIGLYPGSVVVGEESFAQDPAIVAHFSGGHDVWVIDPIDGTRNFIAGSPEFGVMVALVRRGQTIAAWIHHPSSGDILAAEHGGGVWLNQHKMRLAGLDPSVSCVGLMGARLKKHLHEPQVAAAIRGLPEILAGSCAAFDYGSLFVGDAVFGASAAPRSSFIVYRQVKPWDHMPGLMMVREAGGFSADWFGQPNSPIVTDRGLIVAHDRPNWDKVQQALKPVFAGFHLS